MPKKSLQHGTVGLNINYNFKEIGYLATSFLINLWQQEWNTRRNLHHHNLQPLVSKTTQTHHSRKRLKIITRLRVGVVRGLGDWGILNLKLNKQGAQTVKFVIRKILSDISSLNVLSITKKGGSCWQNLAVWELNQQLIISLTHPMTFGKW